MFMSYLKFRLKATDAHGIHSPFVYDLYTKAIRPQHPLASQHPSEPQPHPNPQPPSEPLSQHSSDTQTKLQQLHALRQQARRNYTPIKGADFGAGAQSGSTQKTISSIAKNETKPQAQAQLLSRIAQYLYPQQILELGTSLGFSTAQLSLQNPKANITTIEGNQAIAAQAQLHFQQLGLQNIQLLQGDIDELLPKYLRQLPSPLGIVFFDGNHRYEPTLRYFQACLPYTNAQTVFVFDDIYWSPAMTKAWHEIKAHAQVSLTIDLFHFGLVFFHEKRAKEHFFLLT